MKVVGAKDGVGDGSDVGALVSEGSLARGTGTGV